MDKPKVLVVSELYNQGFPDWGLSKGSSDAFCFDLRSAIDLTLHRGYQAKIPTGIFTALPVTDVWLMGAILRERSGLADKGIRLGAGTIDADYRGQWRVLLRYEPCVDALEPMRPIPDCFNIHKGDRICQIWFAAAFDPTISYVVSPDLLPVSLRSDGGFGSTGVK